VVFRLVSIATAEVVAVKIAVFPKRNIETHISTSIDAKYVEKCTPV
jgi:hypothetical protein